MCVPTGRGAAGGGRPGLNSVMVAWGSAPHLVAAAVAVVRSGENGHHVPVMAPVVALHHKLMCSGDQRHIVRVVELVRYVLSKRVASTSGRNSPPTPIVGIRPKHYTSERAREQVVAGAANPSAQSDPGIRPCSPFFGASLTVTHRALVRHLLDAIERPDLVQCVDGRRKPSVKAEDGVLHQSGQREVVEHVGEVLPHVRVAVLAEAFVIEPVHLRDLARLVVASKDGHPMWIPHLAAARYQRGSKFR